MVDLSKITKERFFDEFLLNQEDLEKLDDATGIKPERAREIWRFVQDAGTAEYSLVHEKNYIGAIYDLGLEPEGENKKECEEERKECPGIYLGLAPIEKVYAGYLLAWEQAYGIFNSVERRP